MHKFAEQLYDYWRSHDRYMVLLANPGAGNCGQRPHRVFNHVLISLGHHIRSLYRNVCENINGAHPRIYRHAWAGCKVGLIAVAGHCKLPLFYRKLLGKIPLVRQVWFTPPMILSSSASECSGHFQRIERNPYMVLSYSRESGSVTRLRWGLLSFLFISINSLSALFYPLPICLSWQLKPGLPLVPTPCSCSVISLLFAMTTGRTGCWWL